MAYAYQSSIAAEIATRLAQITTANGYEVEVVEVIRHKLGSIEDYQHGTVQVFSGTMTRDAEYLGQSQFVRWRQDFTIGVTVRPPQDYSESESEDPEPIDDEIAKWIHAVAAAVDTESQLGGIVDEIHFESFDPVIGSDSELAGVVATLSAAYRTQEADLSTSPTAP